MCSVCIWANDNKKEIHNTHWPWRLGILYMPVHSADYRVYHLENYFLVFFFIRNSDSRVIYWNLFVFAAVAAVVDVAATMMMAVVLVALFYSVFQYLPVCSDRWLAAICALCGDRCILYYYVDYIFICGNRKTNLIFEHVCSVRCRRCRYYFIVVGWKQCDGDGGKRMTVRVRETCVQMVHSAQHTTHSAHTTETNQNNECVGRKGKTILNV